MIERAIAFSLWGDKPRYTTGMLKNAIIAPHVYEGWEVHVFHDRTVEPSLLAMLAKMHCFLHDMTGFGQTGYFWRFLINDMAYRWIVRDADSRLNVRELVAVEEWEKSGKTWHVIRDDEAHTKTVTSGCWGGNRTGLNMRELVLSCGKKGDYGDDEDWIEEYLYPVHMKQSVLEHDYRTNPIPRRRIGHYYVCQVWDENEERW